MRKAPSLTTIGATAAPVTSHMVPLPSRVANTASTTAWLIPPANIKSMASLYRTEKEIRRMSHQIADRIYEKITGVRGVFSTRIAYVLQTGNKYELQIADADGQNPQVMLRSKHSIISPSWAPDGKRLAYVSFESNKPVVYIQTYQPENALPLPITRATIARQHGRQTANNWLLCCLATVFRRSTPLTPMVLACAESCARRLSTPSRNSLPTANHDFHQRPRRQSANL